MINTENGNLVKIIAQAGIAGVALATLYVLWSLIGNHIDHNTEALIKLESTMSQGNTLHWEQTRILQRLEQKLE